MSPEWVTAAATLAQAIMWPAVVIWLVKTFKNELSVALPKLLNESLPGLLASLREIERTSDGGIKAKFDPQKAERLKAESEGSYDKMMKEALWVGIQKLHEDESKGK